MQTDQTASNCKLVLVAVFFAKSAECSEPAAAVWSNMFQLLAAKDWHGIGVKQWSLALECRYLSTVETAEVLQWLKWIQPRLTAKYRQRLHSQSTYPIDIALYGLDLHVRRTIAVSLLRTCFNTLWFRQVWACILTHLTLWGLDSSQWPAHVGHVGFSHSLSSCIMAAVISTPTNRRRQWILRNPESVRARTRSSYDILWTEF